MGRRWKVVGRGEKGKTMTCFAHPPSLSMPSPNCAILVYPLLQPNTMQRIWIANCISCSKIRCSVLFRKIISALHIVLCSFSGAQRSKIRWLAWLGNSPHLLLLRRSKPALENVCHSFSANTNRFCGQIKLCMYCPVGRGDIINVTIITPDGWFPM